MERMRFRVRRKKYLFYPEDIIMDYWSLFITILLLFTCCVTPARIAFVEEDDEVWTRINLFIDIMFFFDIMIVFFTANYDADFFLIDKRKEIAIVYLQGWFFIDVISICPFDLIFSSEEIDPDSTSMIRLVRIGRVSKLVKLTRLLKMLKLIKEKTKIVKFTNEALKIGSAKDRLSFFVLIFLLLSHVVSCLWVLSATFFDSKEGTWLENTEELTPI